MFVQERHEKILSMLNAEGSVRVKELGKLFDVTEDCIRKDLALLEKHGCLKRTYGGAVLPHSNIHAFKVSERKGTDTESKKIIAAKALALIQNGDTIFLDISTSNLELARLLLDSGKKITVVTNMCDVMHTLAVPGSVTLLSTGGMFNSYCEGFTGTVSIDVISKYKFDCGFFGAVGIDVFDNSITTYDADDGYTKAAAIKNSKKTYVMAENKKFSLDGNFKYATLDGIDAIITEKAPAGEIARALSRYHLTVI